MLDNGTKTGGAPGDAENLVSQLAYKTVAFAALFGVAGFYFISSKFAIGILAGAVVSLLNFLAGARVLRGFMPRPGNAGEDESGGGGTAAKAIYPLIYGGKLLLTIAALGVGYRFLGLDLLGALAGVAIVPAVALIHAATAMKRN